MLTQKYLKERLNYNEDSGWLVWKKINRTDKESRRWNTRHANKRAGCEKNFGRRYIGLDGKWYAEHRLIWLWKTGEFPIEELDHPNGDPSDNRGSQLREASHKENMQNKIKYKNNSSGYTGVFKCREKWRAVIKSNGCRYHLGYFDTPELAYAAYLNAKACYHTFQPVPR